jgi:Protein of unknown function (DUF3987)
MAHGGDAMMGRDAFQQRKRLEDFKPIVAEYPHMAQPRLIREAVECACVRRQLSPRMYATVAQAAAALSVQGLAVLKLSDGSIVPLSMYFVVQGKTGSGKTPPFMTFFEPFIEHDNVLEAAFLKAEEEYPSKHRAWKMMAADLIRMIGKKRRDAEPYDHLQAELNKLNREEPKVPRRRNWLMSDATGAAFLKRLKGFRQSAGLATDEGSKILKHLHQYLDDLCQGWSHGQMDSHRVGAGTTAAIDARIMTLILIQPELFDEFCAGQGKRALGIGLWARCLFNSAEATIGELTSTEHLEATTAPIDAFKARIIELITLLEYRINAGITELDVVELDSDAQTLWAAFADEMRTRSRSGGDLVDVSEFAAKAAMHAARLAAIFAYFCGKLKVTLEMMQGAISIIQYHASAYCDQFSLGKVVPEAVHHAEQMKDHFRRLYADHRATSVELDRLHHSNTSAELKLDKHLLPALFLLEKERMIRFVGPEGKKQRVCFRQLLGFAI